MPSQQEIVWDAIKTLQEKGLLSTAVQDSGDNYTMSCPFTDNHGGRREQRTPSFGIHRSTGKWNCFSCHRGGQSVYTLFTALTGTTRVDAELTLGTPKVDTNAVLDALNAFRSGDPMPEPMTAFPDVVAIADAPEALAYMVNGRGIPQDVLERCGVRYYGKDYMPPRMGELSSGVRGKRIIFDICHGDKVVGYSGRSMGSDEPKYYRPVRRVNLTIYNPLNVSPQTHNYVVACEGEISCLAAIREGLPAVCTFGADISKAQAAFLAGFQTAFILFDGDDAGRKGYTEACREFGGYANLRPIILPEKEDPASMKPGWGAKVKNLLDKKRPVVDSLAKMTSELETML